MKYTNSEKKALYESIMKDVSKTVKRHIDEDAARYELPADGPKFKNAQEALEYYIRNLNRNYKNLSDKAQRLLIRFIKKVTDADASGEINLLYDKETRWISTDTEGIRKQLEELMKRCSGLYKALE